MQILRASRGKTIAIFFFAKKKRGTKEKTAAFICLLSSNVPPLLLRNSRFTLIPPKIYDIKTEPQSRAAGVRVALRRRRRKKAPLCKGSWREAPEGLS